MTAAVNNTLWMVELLLSEGADVSAVDRDGENARQLHQNMRSSKILTLNELHEIRDTPVAKLLKAEETRKRRRENRPSQVSLIEAIRVDTSLELDVNGLHV
jgi:hypothetical protein